MNIFLIEGLIVFIIVVIVIIIIAFMGTIKNCFKDPLKCITGGKLGDAPDCPEGYEKDVEALGLGQLCYKPCPTDWPGTSTVAHCQHKTIYSSVGADASQSIPKQCSENKTLNAGLCYTLPDDSWEVTSPGFIGKKCPTTIEGQTIKDSGTTCWYDRGVGKVYQLTCPEGQVKKGLECYEKPPVGYDWTTPGGLLIGKVCPAESHDSGVTCWYDRGVGTIPIDSCPTGTEWYGSGCYRVCPSGYHRTAVCTCKKDDKATAGPSIVTNCGKYGYDSYPSKICPVGREKISGLCYDTPRAGFNCHVTNCSFSKDVKGGTKLGKVQKTCSDPDRLLQNEMCYKKPITGFTCHATVCDTSKQIKSQIGKLPDKCPGDRELHGRLCYPKCPSGYERRSDNLEFCSTICPEGYKNIGIGGCQKPSLKLATNGVCKEGYTLDNGRCFKTV